MRDGSFDAVELLYDSVPLVLSELIRTAFIPKPGCRFAQRCPYATEACTKEDIPFREIEPGHCVACLRAEELM